MLIFWALYSLTIAAFLLNPVIVGWDPAEYLAYGKWIFSDYGFMAGYRPPVWPLVLGVLWKAGFPMPGTMKLLAFLIYAATPLISLTAFKDSRKYLGLVIIAHPVFAGFSHMPLSHIISAALFVAAYSTPGAVSGALVALSGLSRFPFLLAVPFVCWKDKKRWAGAMSVMALYFFITYLVFRSPFESILAAGKAANPEHYAWLWGGNSVYIKALFITPLMLFGLRSKSRFRLAFLVALAYFLWIPRNELRFFIDIFPYLAAALVEGYRKLPLIVVAMAVPLIPLYYDLTPLDHAPFEAIPDGVTVAGMTPEVNAYRDVKFLPWFDYPHPIPTGEYCVYYGPAIPCENDECEAKKQFFRESCEPLAVSGELVVGVTRHPSSGQG